MPLPATCRAAAPARLTGERQLPADAAARSGCRTRVRPASPPGRRAAAGHRLIQARQHRPPRAAFTAGDAELTRTRRAAGRWLPRPDRTARQRQGTNHTMIVPPGPDDDYGARSDPARAVPAGSGPAATASPFLQRWLFSRRILIVLRRSRCSCIAWSTWWLADGQYFDRAAGRGHDRQHGPRRPVERSASRSRPGPARHSDTVPAGDVIRTSPAAGAGIAARRQGHAHRLARAGHVHRAAGDRQPLAQADTTLKTAGLTPGPADLPDLHQHPAGRRDRHRTRSPTRTGRRTSQSSSWSAPGRRCPTSSASSRRAQAAAQQGGFSINPVDRLAGARSRPARSSRQSPAPGTPITPGEVVTVWVSAGPPQVAVPNVTGMNVNQAEAAADSGRVQGQRSTRSAPATASSPTAQPGRRRRAAPSRSPWASALQLVP